MRVIVVLGDDTQLAVGKGATDVVCVRIMKPKRFGDVARRFVSRCDGNIMALQSDANTCFDGPGFANLSGNRAEGEAELIDEACGD